MGLGGSLRAGSSTEKLVRAVLAELASRGAETRLFTGQALMLPPYDPSAAATPNAAALLAAIRRADAVVLGSPAYHGGVSGLVKNAIDYLEETRDDPRPYLDGIPVAPVVTAQGWQAAMTTLRSLREIVHALRGWPTPLGLVVNMTQAHIFAGEKIADDEVQSRITALAEQVLSHERTRLADKPSIHPYRYQRLHRDP